MKLEHIAIVFLVLIVIAGGLLALGVFEQEPEPITEVGAIDEVFTICGVNDKCFGADEVQLNGNCVIADQNIVCGAYTIERNEKVVTDN